MPTDISMAWLLAGLVISSLGFGFFIYGKKQGRIPQLAIGMAMMIYPSLIASPLWIWLISAAALAGLWGLLRAGF